MGGTLITYLTYHWKGNPSSFEGGYEITLVTIFWVWDCISTVSQRTAPRRIWIYEDGVTRAHVMNESSSLVPGSWDVGGPKAPSPCPMPRAVGPSCLAHRGGHSRETQAAPHNGKRKGGSLCFRSSGKRMSPTALAPLQQCSCFQL